MVSKAFENSGHDMNTFFNQKFDNGVNEVLRWFGINLMVSFQNIRLHKTCFTIWSLLLSYIDDMLSVTHRHIITIIAYGVTKYVTTICY